MFQINARLVKIDEKNRKLYGVLASEEKDYGGEIMDFESSLPYFKAWSGHIYKLSKGKSVGNLRSMHDRNTSAGRFTSFTYDHENKRILCEADVVDDNEWSKCLKGVYTGFSVGGDYARKWKDSDSDSIRYTAIPVEGSLVDFPQMPSSTFEIIKNTGETVLRKFVASEADVVEVCEDNGLPLTLEKCLYCISDLAMNINSLKNFNTRLQLEDGEVNDRIKRATGVLFTELVSMAREEKKEFLNGEEEFDLAMAMSVLPSTLEKVTIKLKNGEITMSEEKKETVTADTPPVEKSVDTGELMKSLGALIDTKFQELNKSISSRLDAIESNMDEFSKSTVEAITGITESFTTLLDETPEPPKVVTKSVDSKALGGDIEEKKEVDSKDPVQMMKNVHAGGGKPYVVYTE